MRSASARAHSPLPTRSSSSAVSAVAKPCAPSWYSSGTPYASEEYSPRERGDLGELREHRHAAARPHVVQRQPDVDVDVREHRGEERGLPLVRPAVQQHHRDAVAADPVAEQGGVDVGHPDVAVAETDVELDGKAELHGGLQREALEHRVGQTRGAAPPGDGRGHLRGAGRRGVEAEAGAVGGHRLHADRADVGHGPVQAVTERAGELRGVHTVGRQVLGDLLQPHDVVGAGAGDPGELLRRRQALGVEPGVDQVARGAGRREQAAGHLLGAQLRAARQVVLRRRVFRQVEPGGAVPPDRQADRRVEVRVAGRWGAALADQGLESRAVELAGDDAVTVMIDQ